ncbi:MAG: Peptidoglycan-N-acetylmuramic acid deacetylase PdaA precursor [Pelotomaculum sp. PtaB.Bin104]|nr:MAG: Peptidoglycan-N-acetylmuramic acid deacetylase PdaA precursor [Pelotomaculum sp. PtaB.Bin104]
MKKQLENLKNKKITALAIVVFLLVIYGCAPQSQQERSRTGDPGVIGSDVAVMDSQPGDSSKENGQNEDVPGSPASGVNTGETGAGGPAQNVETPAATTTPGGEPKATPTTGQVSNTKHGWGLKRNNQHLQPEMPASISNNLSRNGAYWVGSPNQKVVYLTFDNGYENGYTAPILDALKANNVRAAFFVTGHYLKSQPELIKRMVSEGHLVCNHTDTHPSLPDISEEQIIKELQAVEQEYERITGNTNMKYLRPPQGEYSERTLAITKELGYTNVFWSMAMVDWVPMPGGAQEAYQTVMDNLHNGAVILLHAVSKENAEAMDRMLKDIKAQGYSFKTLDDLVQVS